MITAAFFMAFIDWKLRFFVSLKSHSLNDVNCSAGVRKGRLISRAGVNRGYGTYTNHRWWYRRYGDGHRLAKEWI